MTLAVTDTRRAAARQGLLLVVLAGMFWGTSGVATKAIYAQVAISPITVAAFRLGLGAPLLLIAYRLAAGRARVRIDRGDLARMLLAGAALGISQACYFAAVGRLGVAAATLVTICTAPVLVGMFSAALLHERVTRAIAAALVCAVAGTVLLIGGGQGGGQAAGGAPAGTFFALGAAVCFATFMLASRSLANRYHPLLSTAMAVGVGAALLLVIAGLTGALRLDYPTPVWTLFLYLGLAPTALAYALFFHGLKTALASEASIAALAEPLTSTILAMLLYGERLGPLGLLGGLLLISVIVFLYRNGRPAAPVAEMV